MATLSFPEPPAAVAFAAESFAPELRLITRGARLRPSSESLEALRGLAEQPLDWKLVGRLGRHHQVLPVVLHHLHETAVQKAITDLGINPEKLDPAIA